MRFTSRVPGCRGTAAGSAWSSRRIPGSASRSGIARRARPGSMVGCPAASRTSRTSGRPLPLRWAGSAAAAGPRGQKRRGGESAQGQEQGARLKAPGQKRLDLPRSCSICGPPWRPPGAATAGRGRKRLPWSNSALQPELQRLFGLGAFQVDGAMASRVPGPAAAAGWPAQIGLGPPRSPILRQEQPAVKEDGFSRKRKIWLSSSRMTRVKRRRR